MKPFRITIHCAASRNGVPYSIEQIRADHVARGFNGVGYHIVIQPDGQVDRGRSLNEVGAHVAGWNTGNIGICLIGNDKFTRKQWDVLRYQIDSVVMTYDIKPWEIWGHYQFDSAIKQGKNCPNVTINRLLAWYFLHREDAISEFIYM